MSFAGNNDQDEEVALRERLGVGSNVTQREERRLSWGRGVV